MLKHWKVCMDLSTLQRLYRLIEIRCCVIYLKVISVTVSFAPVAVLRPIILHLQEPPSLPSLKVWQREFEWAPAWGHIQPFPLLFPKALLTVADHNSALIPNKVLVVFSGSRKLIMAINFEHQQFAPSPAVSPHKVLIQGEGRVQAVAEFTTSSLSITLTA